MKLPLAIAGAGFALLTAAWAGIDAQRAPALQALAQAGQGPVAAFACFDQEDTAKAAKAFGPAELDAGFRVHGEAEHDADAMELVHLKRCAMVSPGVPHRAIRQEAGFVQEEFSLPSGPLRLWVPASDAGRL